MRHELCKQIWYRRTITICAEKLIMRSFRFSSRIAPYEGGVFFRVLDSIPSIGYIVTNVEIWIEIATSPRILYLPDKMIQGIYRWQGSEECEKPFLVGFIASYPIVFDEFWNKSVGTLCQFDVEVVYLIGQVKKIRLRHFEKSEYSSV